MSIKSNNEANRDRFAGDEVKHKNLKAHKAKRHNQNQSLRQTVGIDDWDDAYADLETFEKFGSKR